MAQKITITIPDELFAKLQEVKDRINVSKACQESLTKVVEIETLKKEAKGMNDVIERLKREKWELEKEDEERGFKDGFKHAQSMSYLAMRKISKLYEKGGEGAVCDFINISEDGSVWNFEENGGVSGFCAPGNSDNDDDEFVCDCNTELYFRGWLKGVVEFYNSIKDQL